jgi:hypothetical protein
MAKIQDLATSGVLSGQPVNWPTSPDLIAQIAYDLADLHTHRQTDNLPNIRYHHKFGWHSSRSRIGLRRSEQP